MYMEEGIKRAMDTMTKGYGGPFGAVVVKNISESGVYIGVPAKKKE